MSVLTEAQQLNVQAPENLTWRTAAELAEHAKLLIALVGLRAHANETTIAAALSTTPRQLQRSLAAAGTGFRHELLRVRMRRAESFWRRER